MNIVPLLRLQDEPEAKGMPLKPLLEMISTHFEKRHPDHPPEPSPALLELVDTALRAACCLHDAPARRSALVALVGLRRDLFPEALTYQAVANAEIMHKYLPVDTGRAVDIGNFPAAIRST